MITPAPAADGRAKFKKNSLPTVPRRGSEAGSIVNRMIFIDRILLLIRDGWKSKNQRTKKISSLISLAFQLLLEFYIRIRYSINRNRKHRYKDEPERVRSGKYTGTGNNASDNE